MECKECRLKYYLRWNLVHNPVSKAESGWWRHRICWFAIVVCCLLCSFLLHTRKFGCGIMYALIISVNFNWSNDILPTSLIYQAIIALWLTKLIQVFMQTEVNCEHCLKFLAEIVLSSSLKFGSVIIRLLGTYLIHKSLVMKALFFMLIFSNIQKGYPCNLYRNNILNLRSVTFIWSPDMALF